MALSCPSLSTPCSLFTHSPKGSRCGDMCHLRSPAAWRGQARLQLWAGLLCSLACLSIVQCVKWQHVPKGIEFAEAGHMEAALMSFRQALRQSPGAAGVSLRNGTHSTCPSVVSIAANSHAWHATGICQWNMALDMVRFAALDTSPPLRGIPAPVTCHAGTIRQRGCC